MKNPSLVFLISAGVTPLPRHLQVSGKIPANAAIIGATGFLRDRHICDFDPCVGISSQSGQTSVAANLSHPLSAAKFDRMVAMVILGLFRTGAFPLP